MNRMYMLLAPLALLSLLVAAPAAKACPFCSAESQSFAEELDSMDVVVVARLIAPPNPVEVANPADAVSKARFEILETLKGHDLAKPKSRIETLYYGDAAVGREFLIMGVVEGIESPISKGASTVVWSTPLSVTERSRAYLAKLPTLPKTGPDRLEFFQGYLEDKEEILARDAYTEFARASYDDVKSLKDRMNRDQLVAWIKDADIPTTRRRLYFTMLGVCGTERDVPMLVELLKSEDRQSRSGLDALIGCYLTLTGAEGVALVEDLFLKNKAAEYADTYAAIMALRFHGTEGDIIPQDRLVKAMRHMLNRPELADLVIPDLARWEDWESLDRLVELYKTADEKSSWVRTPIVNYVKACPLPEAKEKLKQLEEIDPGAVKRANAAFPFGPPKPPADAKTSSTAPAPLPEMVASSEVVSGPVATAATERREPSEQPRRVAAANLGARPAAALREKPIEAPNTWVLMGVTGLSAFALLALQWSLLVGGRR
jgi:hypothetical protein